VRLSLVHLKFSVTLWYLTPFHKLLSFVEHIFRLDKAQGDHLCGKPGNVREFCSGQEIGLLIDWLIDWLIFNKHVTDVHAVMQTDNTKHRKISDEKNTNIRTTRLKTKLNPQFRELSGEKIYKGNILFLMYKPMLVDGILYYYTWTEHIEW